MADLFDVENALVLAIDTIRIANGLNLSIYRGWPTAADLDAAMAAGQTHVTIWPDGGMYRVTAVFQSEERITTATDPTLIATISGNTATFAGACSPDQIAGVRVGTTAWAYRCAAGDTASNVASALALLSSGTAIGPAITLPGMADARTGRDVGVQSASRRQEAGLRVTIWTPDPATRDTVTSLIDGTLADTERVSLPDGTTAILRAAGPITSDKGEQSSFYRRDLRYHAEYTTTLARVRTPVLWPGLTYAPGSLRFGALHP